MQDEATKPIISSITVRFLCQTCTLVVVDKGEEGRCELRLDFFRYIFFAVEKLRLESHSLLYHETHCITPFVTNKDPLFYLLIRFLSDTEGRCQMLFSFFTNFNFNFKFRFNFNFRFNFRFKFNFTSISISDSISYSISISIQFQFQIQIQIQFQVSNSMPGLETSGGPPPRGPGPGSCRRTSSSSCWGGTARTRWRTTSRPRSSTSSPTCTATATAPPGTTARCSVCPLISQSAYFYFFFDFFF